MKTVELKTEEGKYHPEIVHYFCDRCGFEIDPDQNPIIMKIIVDHDKSKAEYHLCRYCNRDLRGEIHNLVKGKHIDREKLELERRNSGDVKGVQGLSPFGGLVGRQDGSLKCLANEK